MDSHEAWLTDVQKNKTVKSPYWYGRNLCVRGRGHKPLSFFCPEACGCHRGDEDCPLTCPERDATTLACPMHQVRTYVMDGKDAFREGYICPRRPQAHAFDVGVSGRVAPPTNCAAASTGACLEPAWDGSGGIIVDTDCCAGNCGEGSCAPGYTYAGQYAFDKEALSSTYPDFFSSCGDLYCGNTCCLPVDTNGTAQEIAQAMAAGE